MTKTEEEKIKNKNLDVKPKVRRVILNRTGL